MNREDVLKQLSSIVHPEYKQDIVKLGMVQEVTVDGNKVQIILQLQRANDPFKKSIARAIENAIHEVSLIIKDPSPKKPVEKKDTTTTSNIKHIIAISSGKGGVGKSTVTANLAVALTNMGHQVGILDADIYGPSMPKMFGVEDYLPEAEHVDGKDILIPAQSKGIKIMSIGFFIKPGDALVWRGPMATSALRQMIHDTAWGGIDVLLIDMPPGTGDVHLSIISELKVTGAVVVTTPQQVAIADVRRGVKMFETDNIDIPVIGLIENMAWFTPAELPDNKYYIFGKEGGVKLAQELDIKLLGQIPLVQSICDGSDNGVMTDIEIFKNIAQKLML